MGLKVALHRRAEQDLQEIHDYLLQTGGAQAAERVRAHLRRKVRLLAKSPRLGRPTSNPDIRIMASTRYPYRVYYTLTDAAVIVLHFRHTARRDPGLDDLR